MTREGTSRSVIGRTGEVARLCIVALPLVLSACGGGGGGSDSDAPAAAPSVPAPAPGATKRAMLTAEEMLAPSAPAGTPIANSYYMPFNGAQPVAANAATPALHRFEGRLTVAEQSMSGTTFDSNYGQDGLLQFPGFSAQFTTVESYLVPVERGILARAAGRSNWRMLLSPGRIWSEAADGGWSRASFPFVLANDMTNEAHNGLVTFLYDDTRISALRFQVVQETASWNRNDFWGRLEAQYVPGSVADAIRVQDDLRAELAALTPLRPWSQFAGGNAGGHWQAFLRGLDADDASAAGIVADGVAYTGSCTTRYGLYPYCEFMRHGAFSLTKSMGAALTLMRLAQKYGDEVLQARIADHVPVTAAHAGWNDVRFIHVIDMATGIGDGNQNPQAVDPFSDENAVTLGAWSSVSSEGEKLDAVFGQGDYAWGPGQVFRYNTTQTFVLAVAMQNFLASREGPDAHLWDMMMREVFEPIGIRHAPMMHTEEGGAPGIPLMGIGLYPTIDDLAKVAALLQNGGRHDGVQLLSSAALDDALFRTGRGLPTGERSSAGAHLYSMSFWSLPYRLGARCTRQLPYMEGYGGNFVVLLPNGVTAFRLADADNYDVEALVEVAAAIRPWC